MVPNSSLSANDFFTWSIAANSVDAVIAPLLLCLIVGVIGVISSVICFAKMDHFVNFALLTVAATVEWLICLFYGAVYAEQRRTKLR